MTLEIYFILKEASFGTSEVKFMFILINSTLPSCVEDDNINQFFLLESRVLSNTALANEKDYTGSILITIEVLFTN